MKTKRVLTSLVVAAVVVSFVAACGATSEPQIIKETVVVEKQVEVVVTEVVEKEVEVEVTRVAEEEYEGPQRYVYTVPLVHPYINQVRDAAGDAADDLGVELIWLSPTEYNETKHLEYTESSLSLPGVVAVSVMTGVAEPFDGVLKEAMERGLKVTTNGDCAALQYCDLCMATDHKPAARAVCAHLAELMGGEGKLVISSGEPGATVHQDRIDACQEEIDENWPNIEVIGVLKDCDDPTGTVACAENALSTYPEMNAYYGTGAMNGVGPATIFPEAGRDDILVSAVDDTPEVMEGIRTGSIAFTYVQQPYGQGYLAVWLPYKMINEGWKMPGDECYYLDTGITFVDQSNMDTYQETMKENYLKLQDKLENEIVIKP